MRLDDVGTRIAYFHDATDDFLHKLGVNRSLLPHPDVWTSSYRDEFARPLAERDNYGVMWLIDGSVIGWCNTDKIEFAEQAFMHLHIAGPENRATGFGAHFVALSVQHFFEVLQLDRLYCEPNAFNTAPNRTLQRVGFTYEFTHVATPGSINVEQTTNRWVITEPPPAGSPAPI